MMKKQMQNGRAYSQQRSTKYNIIFVCSIDAKFEYQILCHLKHKCAYKLKYYENGIYLQREHFVLPFFFAMCVCVVICCVTARMYSTEDILQYTHTAQVSSISRANIVLCQKLYTTRLLHFQHHNQHRIPFHNEGSALPYINSYVSRAHLRYI